MLFTSRRTQFGRFGCMFALIFLSAFAIAFVFFVFASFLVYVGL